MLGLLVLSTLLINVNISMNDHPSQTISTQEERCDCGKLLFRKTRRGIEFKCNRCKRIHLIAIDQFDSKYRNLCPVVTTVNAKHPNEDL